MNSPRAVSVEGFLRRVQVAFQQFDARVSAATTDMMAAHPDSAERIADRLNETLGTDTTERSALAVRAFAASSQPVSATVTIRPPPRGPAHESRFVETDRIDPNFAWNWSKGCHQSPSTTLESFRNGYWPQPQWLRF